MSVAIASHPCLAVLVASWLALCIGFAIGWAARFMTLAPYQEPVASDEITGIGA